MESLDLASRQWLSNLPPTLTLATAMGPVMIAHGLGDDHTTSFYPDSSNANFRFHREWRTLLRDDIALHLSGHTHKPAVRWIEDHDERHADGGVLAINAGTLSWRDAACVLMLDLRAEEARFHPVSARGVVGDPSVIAFPRRGDETVRVPWPA